MDAKKQNDCAKKGPRDVKKLPNTLGRGKSKPFKGLRD